MRVCADNGDFLEIESAGSDPDAYDLLILVRVRFRGFAAEIDTWVLRAAWLGFAQELAALEARRQGEAKLQGTSPEELSLVFRSLDRAGHMGVEGVVGTRGYNYTASLQVGVLAFDPSQLPTLVRDAGAITGGEAVAGARSGGRGSGVTKEQEERERVKALLREWDPIGIVSTLRADGLPPNEYDSYAPQVHRTLTDGCTTEALALSLELIRTRTMGLPPSPDADLAAARRIVAWWASRDVGVDARS